MSVFFLIVLDFSNFEIPDFSIWANFFHCQRETMKWMHSFVGLAVGDYIHIAFCFHDIFIVA